MSYNWKHTGSLFIFSLLSHSNILKILHHLIDHFFHHATMFQESGYTISYPFAYLEAFCCFRVLPIMNKAATNIHVQDFVWRYVFNSLNIKGAPFLYHRVCLVLRNCQMAVSFCIPISDEWEFLLLHILIIIWFCQSSVLIISFCSSLMMYIIGHISIFFFFFFCHVWLYFWNYRCLKKFRWFPGSDSNARALIEGESRPDDGCHLDTQMIMGWEWLSSTNRNLHIRSVNLCFRQKISIFIYEII